MEHSRVFTFIVTILLVVSVWPPVQAQPLETTVDVESVPISSPNNPVALTHFSTDNSPHPITAPLSTARAWLDAHNKYRCMHGVPPLKWSEQLAKVAEWRAKNCGLCSHCKCQGASCHPDNAKQWAENATCWAATPETAVKAWYQEVANYDYNNPKWASNTGHFINVVVNTASAVGCYCNGQHCYCDYDSMYGTSAYALSQVVPKPTRTEAACKSDVVVYSHAQKAWQSGTSKCWQLDGHPIYGKDTGRNCTVYWKLGASTPPVIAYGEDGPPSIGVNWSYSLGGGVWQGGGAPDWTPKGCWRLLGFQSWQSALWCSAPTMPTLRGIQVGQQSACWEQLNADYSGTGLVFCEY